jgi:hypothetical protein
MNNKIISILAVVMILILASGCLPGPNALVDVSLPGHSVAGFFTGLWHGVIAPFTFFISLFTDKVSIYEVHNTGGWYDFGFVLGAGILFGGGSRATKRKGR